MLNAMKSWTAIATCAALATTGCASGASMRVAPIQPAPGATANAVLTEYVQKLPAGTVVRVVREEGGRCAEH
jgi:gentisate 1,2-dioxygenase